MVVVRCQLVVLVGLQDEHGSVVGEGVLLKVGRRKDGGKTNLLQRVGRLGDNIIGPGRFEN